MIHEIGEGDMHSNPPIPNAQTDQKKIVLGSAIQIPSALGSAIQIPSVLGPAIRKK